MKEPLMRIGKSQMRVPSNCSSEMRLHLNRAGPGALQRLLARSLPEVNLRRHFTAFGLVNRRSSRRPSAAHAAAATAATCRWLTTFNLRIDGNGRSVLRDRPRHLVGARHAL